VNRKELWFICWYLFGGAEENYGKPQSSWCPQLIFRLGIHRFNLNMSLLELASLIGYAADCEQLASGRVLMALASVCGW